MATLTECKSELLSITRELSDIEWNVRHDSIGISQDLYANYIDRIADTCDSVLKKLRKIDKSRLASWAAELN